MAEDAHKEEAAAGGEHGGGGHAAGGHGGGGHGGGSHEEAHEGAPEWLISFADNVALLMGFFVILLAMNMGPKSTPVQGGIPDENGGGGPDAAMEAIISIREAFHTKNFDPNDPDEAKLMRYMARRATGQASQEGIAGEHQNVQAIRPTGLTAPTASVPFDSRSAVLSPTGRQVLNQVAEKLRDQRWVIEVRGHASPFEIMRDNVKGWELSHERAMAAAGALIEGGLRPENLRLVACGVSDRVVARTYDPEQDRDNQRVEIVVTNDTVQADYYTQTAGEKPGADPHAPDPAPAKGHK